MRGLLYFGKDSVSRVETETTLEEWAQGDHRRCVDFLIAMEYEEVQKDVAKTIGTWFKETKK